MGGISVRNAKIRVEGSENNIKQAQRRAAAETASRKLIEHFIHLMHNSSRHHNCWIYHDFELMCLTRKND